MRVSLAIGSIPFNRESVFFASSGFSLQRSTRARLLIRLSFAGACSTFFENAFQLDPDD